ncbi:hypothetical protein MnTg02_01980 [bacterium MnTg02]|nr:hypothetical protein MnTg02_01980 [bacterium MnTg02]
MNRGEALCVFAVSGPYFNDACRHKPMLQAIGFGENRATRNFDEYFSGRCNALR